MKSYIYSIQNLSNGKCYIGSTNYLKQRKYDHFCFLRKGTHHSLHLQNAYNKYGKGSFTFMLLEECESSIRKEREVHYISIYRSSEREFGYNTHEPNESNFKCSEETKSKIRATKKCQPIDVYLLDGTKVNSYPSIGNCSKELKINHGLIWQILKKKGRKSYKGLTFSYQE